MLNIPQIVPTEYAVLPRMTLHVCATDRFKIGRMSIRALLPNTEAMLHRAALLFPVLRRGTVSFPTQEQINRHLDDMYATDCRVVHGTVGDLRSVGFVSEIPESRVLPDGMRLLPDLIALMSELFFAPVTDDDGALLSRYVASEKGRLLDMVASLVNHPASYASAHFQRAFAEGRDTVKPLDAARLEALTTEDLTALMQYLKEQAHFHVFYIGQTSPEQIIAELQRCFAPYLSLSGATSLMRATVKPLAAREQVFSTQETLNVGQSHLLLGYRTDISLVCSDFYAMMVCNEMLGGSPISRLFVHLREERGLCYSCHSEYLIDRGELILSCGIDRGSRDEAQNAMIEQVTAMQQGEFTDAELQAAKKLLINSYTQLEDNTRAISAFYQFRHILDLQQSVAQCCEAFANVTAEQVQKAAASLRLDTVYFLCGTAADEVVSAGEDQSDESEEIDDV